MRKKRSDAKAKGIIIASDKMNEEQKIKRREYDRAWLKERMKDLEFREKLRMQAEKRRDIRVEQGLTRHVEPTEEQKLRNKERIRTRRAEAKEKGERIPGDNWAKNNPEKQRARVRRWRAENFEKSQEINRQTQRRRRSTPWGKINNRMWTIVHSAMKAKKNRIGKYNIALGYEWKEFRQHMEKHFTEGMSWDNWGEWEMDHIKPLCLFHYTSLIDPLFKEAWSLDNIQVLWKADNVKKNTKYPK